MRRRRRPSGLFTLVVFVWVFGAPARAASPVWDAEEIARLTETSAKLSEGLSVAVELLNAIDDSARTIGRFGTLPTLDFTRFDATDGLRGTQPDIGGLSADVARLQSAEIASVAAATSFVGQLTAALAVNQGTSKAGQARQAIEALHKKALEDAYALAAYSRESVSMAPLRAGLLVGQASSSVDLRGDTAANTAVALALMEQVVSLRAMLAAILEIQATQVLRKVGIANP
jgi:hypothetical protein